MKDKTWGWPSCALGRENPGKRARAAKKRRDIGDRHTTHSHCTYTGRTRSFGAEGSSKTGTGKLSLVAVRDERPMERAVIGEMCRMDFLTKTARRPPSIES
jgi:hypothetical protein